MRKPNFSNYNSPMQIAQAAFAGKTVRPDAPVAEEAKQQPEPDSRPKFFNQQYAMQHKLNESARANAAMKHSSFARTEPSEQSQNGNIKSQREQFMRNSIGLSPSAQVQMQVEEKKKMPIGLKTF